MNRSVSLSVAMCTYSGERFLPEQLESIASQDRPPDEVVVCDDGSEDATLEILRSFASRSTFPVHVQVNDRTLGPTKNFEQAIRRCDGDVVVLSDQDDIWLPQKLARLEQIFVSSPETGGVFTDAPVVGPDSRPLGYTVWEGVRFSPTEQEMFRTGGPVEVLLRRNVATGATMAFRSPLPSAVLPIPAAWVHDAWIAIHLAVRQQLSFLVEPLTLYRQHEGNRIGMAGGTGIVTRWRRAQDTHGESYAAEAARFRVVYERLSVDPDCPQSVLRQIEDKIDHLAVRASMPRKKTNRLAVAVRELPRYRRWSPSGWKSAVKDVFLRP